jgi:hypothetical protein
MLLRTVVVGYLGATLAIAGTGMSAYMLLQARHGANEVGANEVAGPSQAPAGMALAISSEPAVVPSAVSPVLPPLLPPHVTPKRRLPRLRPPVNVASHDHRIVHPAAAVSHLAAPPVRYRVYYTWYYPYGYYGYYPYYPSYPYRW